MHEMAITQNMFEIVLKQAKESGAKKITGINLVIGEMTGVVADCVQFYLDFMSKGTIAEGAKLSVKSVPAKAECLTCHHVFEIKEAQWTCPRCGSAGLEITAGKELFVESIEVD